MSATQELQLAKPESQVPAVRDDPEAILRFAIEKGADIGTIERMMVVRDKLKAEQAKEAFDRAMAAFQAECPVIVKNKDVNDLSGSLLYKYCPLEYIIAQVRPLLQKHGFSYALDTDLTAEAGYVIAVCKAVHQAGHSECSKAKFRLGTKTRAMSDTQVDAAALTFASRRAFQNAFGIVVAGEDSDGQTEKPKGPGPSTKQASNPSVRDLVKELWSILPASVAGKNPNWKLAKQLLVDENLISPEEHGGDEYAPSLTPERFREVIKKANEKLK